MTSALRAPLVAVFALSKLSINYFTSIFSLIACKELHWMATRVFHSFSYVGWLPCAKYDRGCGSRKFSTLSRKTRGRRKTEKTKKDAGKGKTQESTRWILPSFLACSAAPTISTFKNNFVILCYLACLLSQIYFVCQKASLWKLSLYARCIIS